MLGLLIGKTFVRIDYSTAKPLIFDHRVLIQFKNCRKCIFFLIGTQRTGIIGEHLRQHRYHAIYQVDRSRPIICLIIKNGIHFQVMGNIGYMNPNFIVPILQNRKRKRIIKILGILRVYRKGQYVPHIPSFGYLLFFDCCIKTIGKTLYLYRKFIG